MIKNRSLFAGKDFYLEEFCNSDYLRDTYKQIPGSHILLKRLNIQQIKDPFSSTDEEDFQWNILKE